MINGTLLKQIEEWHLASENDKIYKTILALPDNERTDELMCLLVRALNCRNEQKKALQILDSINDTYSDNPYYCVRRGLSLFQLNNEHESLLWFKKAHDLGLEEINDNPGTYLPTSVIEYIKRAEKWGAHRIEKNSFEAQCRLHRIKTPQNDTLTDIDLEGIWSDSPYSIERYVGSHVTDQYIVGIETELGYRLPTSYKGLIKKQNGGILMRNTISNPLQRSWEVEIFSVNSIYGIDRQKTNSLCGT